jgi:hypothetical protein
MSKCSNRQESLPAEDSKIQAKRREMPPRATPMSSVVQVWPAAADNVTGSVQNPSSTKNLRNTPDGRLVHVADAKKSVDGRECSDPESGELSVRSRVQRVEVGHLVPRTGPRQTLSPAKTFSRLLSFDKDLSA